MADNNFYEWLELPVEHFESDPQVLKQTLENHIVKWTTSRNMKIQDRVKYKGDIIEAFYNRTIWLYMYNKYKRNIDGKLFDIITICADSTGNIPLYIAANMADRYNVSVCYVEKIAKQAGKGVGYNRKLSETNHLFQSSEGDIKIKYMLDALQKLIIELGYTDLAELICSELNIQQVDISSLPKDETIMALKDIKKKWSKVATSHPVGRFKKINIDRLCSGMLAFLNKYEIADYFHYLHEISNKDC